MGANLPYGQVLPIGNVIFLPHSSQGITLFRVRFSRNRTAHREP